MAQLLSPAELLSTMSVLDNGTNIGTAAHKASISSGQTFSLERRGSSGSQEVIHGMSSMTMTSETVTTPALSRGGSKSGRRGSGSVLTPSGQHVVYHTRTQDEVDFPHAGKKTIADHLRKYESLLTVTAPRMRMIVQAFEETLDKGLKKNGETVPMIPTYVFGWPSGKEHGEFLAVDLGGTNLRVCLVTLEGEGKFEVTQTKYRLTEEQKQEEGQKLFDFCAECLHSFIRDNLGRDENADHLPLGFTDRIDHGELIRWTKGFGAPNVEGHDVAAMFQESLKKFGVRAELTALINDTTGTLIASNYVDPTTRIACIFGTGCNAAYMETAENIPKMDYIGLPKDQDMAINCEWGAFDSFEHQHLPRTKYDIIIDESSNKVGEQSFEKMIAGLYLGEIFRLILCELIDSGDLFLGQNTYKLEKAYAFDTAFLSLMEADPTDELLMTIGVFNHFFGIETTLEERQFFRQLAVLIGTRSARLSACGIAAIVSKKGYLEKGCSVGADGSLYNKYPHFADRIHQALVDIFGEAGKKITTHPAEDGSGVGSAIIAAMTKIRKTDGVYVNY
ncbi:hexokinase A [Apiotrichum porosum]|uniref:Phosphotransferase n=1 Tax=Apiotrichum porosum TaxID=105984 RepID=A0A427Y004_9TREE|nr:hexokinase A [Apiotrichum porosum]RSH84456.1 hexokinase A [Apiotrichum porosum]